MKLRKISLIFSLVLVVATTSLVSPVQAANDPKEDIGFPKTELAKFLTVKPTMKPSLDSTSQDSEGLTTQQAFCILGFSKNLCNGTLSGGVWEKTTCFNPDGTICNTLVGTSAQLKVPLSSNPDQCGSGIADKCDETQFNGTLVAKLDFYIRQNGPCQFRGCYRGTYSIFDANGVVIANGNMNATFGVGTHRTPSCIVPQPQKCGPNCEKCYAVQPTLDNPPGWNFHTEGFLDGQVISGQHAGCEICVSFQGNFLAKGDDTGMPITPDISPWQFCGTADGVLKCPCIFP